jgi:hypothetical protein
VWLFDRLRFPPSTVNVGPAGAQTELALDKRKQIGAALLAGLSVPATGLFDNPEAALEAWTHFPVMVRPCWAIEPRGAGLGARPGSACANRDELVRALEPYADGGAFFLQPFKLGRGEGLFGLARDGEVLAWSSHHRVRMMSPHGSGSSACIPWPVDQAVLEPAGELIRNARWNGIFMIELLRQDDGQVWFIELNGRAWGSMALSRRMGYEFPAWTVRSALEEGFEPPLPESREAVVCRHLGRELVHLLIVMRGPKSSSIPPWPSRLRTLFSVMKLGRRDRWYNLRRGAFSLFVDDTIETVRTAVSGARHR